MSDYYPFDEFNFRIFPLKGRQKKLGFRVKWEEYREQPYPHQIKNTIPRACITGTIEAYPYALTVIDIDFRTVEDANDFDIDRFVAYLDEKCHLPTTRIARTPSGGYHLYYLSELGIEGQQYQNELLNDNGFTTIQGIDTRSNGNIVVFPPTEWTVPSYQCNLCFKEHTKKVEVCGYDECPSLDFIEIDLGQYTWFNSVDLAIVTDEQLLKFVKIFSFDKVEEKNVQGKNYLIDVLSNTEIKDGNRNHFAFSLANFLYFHKYSKADAYDIARTNNTYVEIENEDNQDFIAQQYEHGGGTFREVLDKLLPGFCDRYNDLTRKHKSFRFYVSNRIYEAPWENKNLIHSEDGLVVTHFQKNDDGDWKFQGKQIISNWYIINLEILRHPFLDYQLYAVTMKYMNREVLIANNTIDDLVKSIRKETSAFSSSYGEYIKSVIIELISRGDYEEIIEEPILGFTINEGSLVFLDNDPQLQGVLTGDYDEDNCVSVLKFLDQNSKNIPDPSHYSAILKFGLAAPLQWARLQREVPKKHLILAGRSDSAKTYTANIVLKIWNAPAHFSGSKGSVTSEARLVNMFRESTLPKYIDEAKSIMNPSQRAGFDPYEYIKVSDINFVIRTIRSGDQEPIIQLNLASFIFSFNGNIEVHEDSILKRLHILMYDNPELMPYGDVVDSEERIRKMKEYGKNNSHNLFILPHLGNFLIRFIPEIVSIDNLLVHDIFELGEYILAETYTRFGLDVPDWVYLQPKLSMKYEDHDNAIDVERVIRNYIINILQQKMRGHYIKSRHVPLNGNGNGNGIHEPTYPIYSYYDIFGILEDRKQLPEFFGLTRMYRGIRKVMIYKEFISAVNQDKNLELVTLKSLMEYFEGYDPEYNNDGDSNAVVKLTLDNMVKWLEKDNRAEDIKIDEMEMIDFQKKLRAELERNGHYTVNEAYSLAGIQMKSTVDDWLSIMESIEEIYTQNGVIRLV